MNEFLMVYQGKILNKPKMKEPGIVKDNIAFGAMAGAIGGAAGIIFSYTMFRLGISPMSSIHLAASLVVMDIVNLTTGGIIWAIVTHLLIASVYGILLTNFFLHLGKKYWVFKAIGLGALFCLIAHSYLIPLMRTDIQVRSLIFNAPSFGTMITTHSIISLVAAIIIVNYHQQLKAQSS